MKKKKKNSRYHPCFTIPIDILWNPSMYNNHEILLHPNKLLEDRYGLVINEDVSTGPGTHWVSLMFDGQRKEVFYFDSCSQSTCKEEIRQLLLLYIKNKWKIFMSVFHQQYGETECGVYCIIVLCMFVLGYPITKISVINRVNEIIKEFRTYKGPM